jgi:phosphoesterase RecJ-like protein
LTALSQTSVADAHTHASSKAREIALNAVLACIHQHQRFLVVSHARPDGDAVGSVLAMGAVLHQLGKTVDMVLADAVPAVYRSLPGVTHIREAQTVDPTAYDAAIILECDGIPRTGIRGLDGIPLINIDHHLTGCNFATVNWIDPEASAVAAMVYQVAVALDVQITPGTATCLYTALLTDTGSFTYPGTSADTFTLAHELIDLGAKADSVARDVLYSVPAARIHLLGVALSRLKILGSIAWTYVTQADLEALAATDEDSEGTVNYLISIAGVEAAAFLREMPLDRPGAQQTFRTSLRSKSSVDVSMVAALRGGGGHRNAAGCTINGPLDDAMAQVLGPLEREVERVARETALNGTAQAAYSAGSTAT